MEKIVLQNKTQTDRQTNTTTTKFLWGSTHQGIINSTYGADASVLVQIQAHKQRSFIGFWKPLFEQDN